MGSRVAACCLLNISEARNTAVVEKITLAAIKKNPPLAIETSVLNVFRDEEYNRSVLTLASQSTVALLTAIGAACEEAFASIDLSFHFGGHPRLGAVDLAAIHPIDDEVTMSECGRVAKEAARTLSERVEGTSFFLFGHGEDGGLLKPLVERRREVGWFRGLYSPPKFPADFKPDYGRFPGVRSGLTGIGAIPYMMNVNNTISTRDLKVGKVVADSIREATGGLPGVRAMAFAHGDNVEIACNVEAVPEIVAQSGYVRSSPRCSLYHASPELIRKRIGDALGTINNKTNANISFIDESTIVGYTPGEIHNLGLAAFTRNDPLFYRTRKNIYIVM